MFNVSIMKIIAPRLTGFPYHAIFCDKSKINYIAYIYLVYIKEGIQVKGIWKQDPEANIWALEGWEWRAEKAPQWGTS